MYMPWYPPWCTCPVPTMVYMPVYTTPGTPSHQPAILRCTGNPAWDGFSTLEHAVAEQTFPDARVTVGPVTVTRFTVG